MKNQVLLDAIRWPLKVEERGDGEILPISKDKDGTKEGRDIPMIKAISERVGKSVIASGGCGTLEQLHGIFQRIRFSSARVASIFNYKNYSIRN